MNMKLSRLLSITLCIAVILSFLGSDVHAMPISRETRGVVLYVKESVSGDCSSWENACDLQTALFTAVAGDEIWVAEGTYYPTDGTDRTISFNLMNGVAVYGGFTGTETARDQRDWVANPTNLSGDIGVTGSTSDNSYHVVANGVINSSAVLDGFTITAGNADGENLYYKGGGMYNYDNSTPTLTNVTFSANSADSGGGMYNENSSPTLTNITFSGNPAAYNGGGMYNSFSSPALSNVTFSTNSAEYAGGGMYNYNSSPTLSNATFSTNSAEFVGGGIYNCFSSPTLTNVTFYGNSVAYDSGGGMFNESSNPSLTNAILWGNTPDQIYNLSNTPVITYSIIYGGYAGEGNINSDPLLGPLADNGGVTSTHDLGWGSPAIDSGSPTVCPATDQRGVTRPIDGNGDGIVRCDIGAYEYEPGIFIFNFLPLIVRRDQARPDDLRLTTTSPSACPAGGPSNAVCCPR